MNAARREVLKLFGVALLLLPLCLAGWYFAAGAIAWVPSKIAALGIGTAAGKVTKVETAGRNVAFVVDVEGRYRPGSSQRAEARVDVPANNYTYGLAVFAALALAVRGWRKPVQLAIGVVTLLVLPAIGIAFDALRSLGQAAELAPLLEWKAGTREAIALGYQVGSLLLPTLAPIVAWLVLYPDVLKLSGRSSADSRK